MQNFPKCSLRRLPVPTTVHVRAGAAFALALVAESHGSQSPASRLDHEATANSCAALDRVAQLAGIQAYSIRALRSSGAPCATCGIETGMGPVGHCGDDPVCDRCLLEQCEPLGMVLALVAVTRAYAIIGTDEPDDARESLVELGGFARIFEHVIAKWGPARLITPGDHVENG